MNKPSIVFLDLDGTTLDGQAPKWYMKQPTEYTCDILTKANKLFPVVICTGRSANDNTKAMVAKMGLNSLITWNGAEITHYGEKIYQAHFDDKIAKEFFNELHKHNLNAVFNSNAKDCAYTKNIFSRIFMGWGRKTAKYHKSFNNDFIAQKALVTSANPFSYAKLATIIEEWKTKFANQLEFTLGGDDNNIIEVTPANISKGNAELWFANFLGVDPKQGVHIGDSLNDASTKGKIGKLIAVANAHPDLLAQADEILPWSCDESAVAKYLEQFLD